jgi:microcystin-dependent protein
MTKARDLADLLDASGNIIAQGTIDGRDLASDGSKLDSIEHGATGDQTHSEIRALIEVGVDTNVFTDADHTKLDGIEANATADQTAAEIKTSYESNANTNAFTDTEQTKLSGIEAGATADQTASEIRALVESATDSNAFTDADHTKLNGIESGATADQTKADIDALNIDADTLDGQHGSYYTGYTDTAVANLVDSAPGTLDTLNELAAALGDDPNFATTTATNIGTKANKTITVSAGSGLTGGGDLTANRTISHADTSSVSSVNGSGNTFIQDIGFDTYGHVTSVGTGTVTVGDGAMTVTAGSGLSGGGQLGTANQSGASSVTVSHADTSSQASVNNSNGTVIQDITLDTYGHITGIASANLDGRYYTESEADSRFLRNQVTFSSSYSNDVDNVQGIAFLRIQGGSNGAFSSHHNMLQIPNTSSSQYDVQLAIETDSDPQFKFRAGYGGSNNSWSAWRQVFHDSYHPNADKWTTARTLSLSGDASGSVSWDGSGNATLSVSVGDADTVDGIHGSSFLRSDTVDSLVPSGWTSPNTYAALNIGYNGSGQTRAIDIDGSWASGESKTISFTHGSSSTNLVGQFEVRFDNPASRMRWGRLYHGGDSSVYPMELVSQSQTTANLYVTGTVEATSFTGDGSNLTGIDAGAPAGSIIYHAGSSAPSGYVKANGASLSTSTYAALFSAIGYTFGGSGGSFNVPDLRGEFLRGWDDSRGVDSGRSFGSSQLDQMQRLTGGYNTSAEHFNIGSGSGVFNDYRVGGARNSGIGYGNATRLDFDSANSPSARVSSSTSGETRPRNIALLACIKY